MAKKGRPKADKPMRPQENAPAREREFDVFDYPQLAGATSALRALEQEFAAKGGAGVIDRERGARSVIGNALMQRDLLLDWSLREDLEGEAGAAVEKLTDEYEQFIKSVEASLVFSEEKASPIVQMETVQQPKSELIAEQQEEEAELLTYEQKIDAMGRAVDRMSPKDFARLEQYTGELISAELEFAKLVARRSNLNTNQARVEFNRIASSVKRTDFAKISRTITPEVAAVVEKLRQEFVAAKKRASESIDDISVGENTTPRLELKALSSIFATREALRECSQAVQRQTTKEDLALFERRVIAFENNLEADLAEFLQRHDAGEYRESAEQQIALQTQISSRLARDFSKKVQGTLSRENGGGNKHKEKGGKLSEVIEERVLEEEREDVAKKSHEREFTEGPTQEQLETHRKEHERILAELERIALQPVGASHAIAVESLDEELRNYAEAINENPYYWQLNRWGELDEEGYSARSQVTHAFIFGQDPGEYRALIKNPEALAAVTNAYRRVGERYLEVGLEKEDAGKFEIERKHLHDRITEIKKYLEEHGKDAFFDNVDQQIQDIDAEIRALIKKALDPKVSVYGSIERDIFRRSCIAVLREVNKVRHMVEILQKQHVVYPYNPETTLVLQKEADTQEEEPLPIFEPSAEDERMAHAAELVKMPIPEASAPIIPQQEEVPAYVPDHAITPEIAPPMLLDDPEDDEVIAPRNQAREEGTHTTKDTDKKTSADIAVAATIEAWKSGKEQRVEHKEAVAPVVDPAEFSFEKKYPRIELTPPVANEAVQDLTKAAIPSSERPKMSESPSLFGRLKGGLQYLAGARWAPNVTESETWRVHVKGELTPEERGERELTRLSAAAKFTGALISGAMSYGGVAIIPDALRYVSQSYYTKSERERLLEPLREIATARERNESVEKLEGRANALREKIISSSYLSRDKKQELLERLQGTAQTYMHARQETREAHAKVVAKAIEESVKNRVTGMKVAKESANTLFALLGVGYLRGPAYGVFSMVGRWQKVTHDFGEGKRSGSKVKALLLDGFRDWARAARGKEGVTWTERRLSQVQAVGTLARAAGLTAATLEALPPLESVKTLLEAFAQKMQLDLPVQAQVSESVPLLRDVIDAPVVENVAEPELLADEILPAPSEMEIETGGIDDEAVVTKGDGITYPMYRSILKNPEKFGYSGNGDQTGVEQFARSFVYKIAKRDGFLDKWLLEKDAVGKIAVMPVEEGGVWHASFIDIQSGETLNGQQLVDRKIVAPAPARA